MDRRLKLKNNDYWDSQGIKHGSKFLNNILADLGLWRAWSGEHKATSVGQGSGLNTQHELFQYRILFFVVRVLSSNRILIIPLISEYGKTSQTIQEYIDSDLRIRVYISFNGYAYITMAVKTLEGTTIDNIALTDIYGIKLSNH